MSSTPKTYFSVHYEDPKDGETLTLKARSVMDSSLGLGFVAMSDFVFEKHKLVVSPDEEALMKRLENVKTFHISIHSILSISEVGEENLGLQFKNDRSNLVVLPSPSGKSKN